MNADPMSHLDEPANPARADDEAEFLRAREEISLGKPGAARDRLLGLRARLTRPSAMLELQLGYACRQLGDSSAAIEAAREAIRLAPQLAAARDLLATLW